MLCLLLRRLQSIHNSKLEVVCLVLGSLPRRLDCDYIEKLSSPRPLPLFPFLFSLPLYLKVIKLIELIACLSDCCSSRVGSSLFSFLFISFCSSSLCPLLVLQFLWEKKKFSCAQTVVLLLLSHQQYLFL